MATSREALGCEGERILVVPPLSVESDVGLSDAERLFVERVDGLVGGFEPDEDDRAAVAEMCTRLDGVPLALELAAARVGPLGLHEVRARLARKLDSLGHRHRGDARHHSLTTAVAWSYELLSPDEQRVFERLSVFADGFDLSAADAVCGYPPVTGSVEDHVVSLIDKSLVSVQRSTPVRYRQLEMVRQYAEDRLTARGESEPSAARFLTFFVDWVQQADTGVRGPDELRWHGAFLAEWNNLRNAFDHAIATNDLDAACHLVWHAQWWAAFRLRLEVGEWADAALSMAGADVHPLIPIVGAASAFFARVKSDWLKADAVLTEAETRERILGLAPEPFVPYARMYHEGLFDEGSSPSLVALIRRAAGSPFWEAVASQVEASGAGVAVANLPANVVPGEDQLRRIRLCVERVDAVGNPSCIARAAGALGTASRHTDPLKAVAVLEGSLASAQSLGNDEVACEDRADLALLYEELGRDRDAIGMLGAAVREYTRDGAWGQATTMAQASLRALINLGRPRTACLLAGWLRKTPLTDLWQEYFNPRRLEATLEQELGPAEMARLFAHGKRLTEREIVSEVLQAIEELEADAP